MKKCKVVTLKYAAIGFACLVMGMATVRALDLPDIAPAFFFIDIQSSQMQDFQTRVADIPGSGKLQRVPFLRGRILEVNGEDPDTRLTDARYG